MYIVYIFVYVYIRIYINIYIYRRANEIYIQKKLQHMDSLSLLKKVLKRIYYDKTQKSLTP